MRYWLIPAVHGRRKPTPLVSPGPFTGATSINSGRVAPPNARGGFTLTKPVDQGQLFIPFFEYAERLAEGEPFVLEDARTFVDDTLRKSYMSESGKSARNASLENR